VPKAVISPIDIN